MLDIALSCIKDKCLAFEACPYGNTDTCEPEEKFMTAAKEWTQALPQTPLNKLKTETLLNPLLRQYFRLRLAQEFTGRLVKDANQTVKAIGQVLG